VAPAATRYQALTFSARWQLFLLLRRDEEEHIIGILYAAPCGGTPRVIAKEWIVPLHFRQTAAFAFHEQKHDVAIWDLVMMKATAAKTANFQGPNLLSDSLTPAGAGRKNILMPVCTTDEGCAWRDETSDIATGKLSDLRLRHPGLLRSSVDAGWPGAIVPSMDLSSRIFQAHGYLSYPDGRTGCSPTTQ